VKCLYCKSRKPLSVRLVEYEIPSEEKIIPIQSEAYCCPKCKKSYMTGFQMNELQKAVKKKELIHGI